MKIAVLGGDERFAWLVKLLRDKGIDARGAWMERAEAPGVKECGEDWALAADVMILGWPLRCQLSAGTPDIEGILERYEGKLLFCGPKRFHGEARDGRIAADLWEDEAYLRANAALTAEGALYAAMSALKKSVGACRCMVIGFGRIGSCLAELLRGIGAEVTVASGKPEKVEKLGFSAVNTRELERVLPGCDAVFSTAPGIVLDRQKLEQVPSSGIVIDLASPPYGVDLAAAWDLGLRAWREPGLPGRYCPESAAMALLRALEGEVR